MRELARGKRVRVVALAALVVALAAGVTLGATLRGGGPGATAQTTATGATPATVLPANPPTCTAKTLGVSRASNPALATDCDTLLAIQSTLRVSGWINYDTPSWWDHSHPLNWFARSPLKHWRTVTLGGTPQRVIGLDFSDTRESVKVFNARTRQWAEVQPYTREWTLRGVIPTQLGNLTALEVLDLGGSELTGAVPTQLGALTKLTRLDLGDNKLTGVIPTQLGSLTALTSLDLSDNALSGGLPAGLRDLPPTLATLRLAGNAVTGCLDERLRLAATNDLATLMKARSLSWCPVVEAPRGRPLAAGTYHINDSLIIDIPAGSPQVKVGYIVLVHSLDPNTSGNATCFSDINEQWEVCLDTYRAVEWGRSVPISKDRTGHAPKPAGVEAIDAVFDKISETARTDP